MLRVLGVDPGLTRCGVGVVEVAPNRRARLVHVTVVRTPADMALEQRLLRIADGIAAEIDEEDGIDLGFDLQIDPALSPGGLWISSDGYGEPEHVIRFVIACAEAFSLHGRWGFCWALTCSKPRLDGFGGGAQVIDLDGRTSMGWTDCDHWLNGMLDPAMDTVAQA